MYEVMGILTWVDFFLRTFKTRSLSVWWRDGERDNYWDTMVCELSVGRH